MRVMSGVAEGRADRNFFEGTSSDGPCDGFFEG